MAYDYDKILKENIASVFLLLTGKSLGIRTEQREELKDKLQTTIEKEPDFIRIVQTGDGDRFILQLAFQGVDEEGMVYRMQGYYGILRKKYRLPVGSWSFTWAGNHWECRPGGCRKRSSWRS